MAKVRKNDAELIDDEVEAIDGYDKAIDNETDPERKEVLEHIRDEEKEHIEEIANMDKNKDITTSDEAWQDFKSNYDKDEFDQAHKDDVTSGDSMAVTESKKVKNMKSTKKSTDAQNESTVEGKLDTVASMINELETDVERTLDVIPQVEGQVAGEVAEGTEAEDELFGTDDMFGDDTGEETPADAEAGDEEAQEGDVQEQPNADENPVEETQEGEEQVDEAGDQSSDEADPDAEAGDEDVASDDDEELMEKMVKTLVKQNKLIKSLTERVEELERTQKNMTVQTQKSVKKANAIRHHPIYKSVGVVSKPPVQNGFNSQFNVGDDEGAVKSFKDPKALVANYKNKGIL